MASRMPRRLSEGVTPGSATQRARRAARLWLGVGIAGAFLVWHFQRRAELYILCGLFGTWGVALLSTQRTRARGCLQH